MVQHLYLLSVVGGPMTDGVDFLGCLNRRLNKRLAMSNNHSKEQGIALVELVLVSALCLIITGIAVPNFLSTVRNYRSAGDSQEINSEIMVAKMRAASDFTQARARFNIAANNGYAANSFQIETWDKTNNGWALATPNGTVFLSQGITLMSNFGTLTPPAGTQATIGQASACKTGPSGTSPGTDIADTACVVFNSRGIPIDATAAPNANDAIYITDGAAVYVSTLLATGQIQTWHSDIASANWQKR